MKRVTTGLVGLGLAASLGFAYTAPSNAATSPPDSKPDRVDKTVDELPNPLETKRRALRSEAVANVVSGKSKPIEKDGISVVKVGKSLSPQAAAVQANKKATKKQKAAASGKTHDQYVELQQERADKIFVILAEFGNQRHPDFPDQDTDPSVEGPSTFEGPLHNAIPEPDRTKDNSTVWQADYNRKHYQDLYFGTGKGVESVKTYYEKQSSGRYTVDGTVSDWVKVPYNEARYGRDDSSRTVWNLIQDAVAAWVQDQKDAGKSDADIKKMLQSYDKYDRYDYDGDGDFNEPDGYVDHFQIVHAGGDEADGDPQQGEDAIWSHRWYAYYTDQGLTGPDFNKLGGTQVGNTGIWVGDYTAQPENGGLSVFVHEYGHDLGLPDDYDTSGGGDNNSEYWTLMAQSRLNGKDEPLGSRPGDLGAWNKLQLGWLDYEVVGAKEKRTLELGPQEYNSSKAQGAVVVLPDKNVTVDNGSPASGQNQFWSTKGDNLNSSMTTDLDLTGAADATLTAKVRYSIEEGYDYGYLQVSTDGGSTWTTLDGTIDGQPMDKDASDQSTFSGEHPDWGNLEVPLTSVAGKNVKFRAIYKTDGGVAEQGLFLDDIKVTKDGATVLEDGAEDGGSAWTFDKFTIVGATSQKAYDNFYIAGHRSYVSYDRYLKTGPYNFGFTNTKPDWVEHYKYGHGLLVSYWDTSQADNNTNEHPGVGRNMIIDANARPIINTVTGAPWRARIQMYDAPFSLHTADSMTLHTNGKASYIRGQKAQPVFDDTKKFWFPTLPNHGVKLPAVGVKIKVLTEDGTSMKVRFN
ncbi:immune inhibitor A domain-containing protein [Aeromicrobium terrae]|uniref:M6 family metalloprotease domain-containing protein n=1 Tax=Aeromicrobium terrae TaxID=2498846 RepID=A0A5C8NQ70_9ACTN|nr:immune inhibitor A domain-containing protein [Aeromicrobium terrae]TXL63230.1 M6 family metalloprotease domain-containing protein [Aeromicrobium terrae]